jgi:hypothetical protein
MKKDNKQKLTKKQSKQLQKLTDEILTEAQLVVDDYRDFPSDASGSLYVIHENSPFLDKKNVVKKNKKS